MILEIAAITVKPGLEKDFEAGVAKAVPAFESAKGCHGMELVRSHETPGRYILFVRWESVEAHTVDFRGSSNFQQWRAFVSDFFETPPQVEHVAVAFHGFGGTIDA
jgi:heme-degrading monooxygenase HmoA